MRIRPTLFSIVCVATFLLVRYRRDISGGGSAVPQQMANMRILSPTGRPLSRSSNPDRMWIPFMTMSCADLMIIM